MVPDQIVEWCRLGHRLAEVCPEKFEEILDALRDTVDAQQILSPVTWMLAVDMISRLPQA